MCWGALASMNPRTAVSAGHWTVYLNRHGCVAVNFTVPPPVPVVVNGTGGYSNAGVGAGWGDVGAAGSGSGAAGGGSTVIAREAMVEFDDLRGRPTATAAVMSSSAEDTE
jgi:hypothetical protein